jgi:hypothetical protein
MKKGTITQIEPTLKEAAPSFISSRKLGVISSPAMNKITIADSSPLSESSQEKQEAFHQKMVEHLMPKALQKCQLKVHLILQASLVYGKTQQIA